jgi:hypothetical protein
LNQNRNQNRRRGRGNNRGGQGGGQGNRIDSRARGNAPQMLEKYKKLAHDASLNGDRVLTEYYLQFADHYFRVVADSRQQRDDGRPAPRPHDRDQPFGADDYESEEREENGRDEGPRGEQPRPRRDRYEEARPAADEGQRASEGEQVDEAVAEENPFVREARPPRERSGQRPRGRGRPANDAREDADDGTFDAAVLPPSIAREPHGEEADEAPRPARGRGRRARPVDDEGDEALEAVS